jgi:hypothetical protein
LSRNLFNGYRHGNQQFSPLKTANESNASGSQVMISKSDDNKAGRRPCRQIPK